MTACNASAPADEAQSDGPKILMVDLMNVVRIIDTAAERGAFRGPELSSVGKVREKIAAYLTAVGMPAEISEDPDPGCGKK